MARGRRAWLIVSKLLEERSRHERLVGAQVHLREVQRGLVHLAGVQRDVKVACRLAHEAQAVAAHAVAQLPPPVAFLVQLLCAQCRRSDSPLSSPNHSCLNTCRPLVLAMQRPGVVRAYAQQVVAGL